MQQRNYGYIICCRCKVGGPMIDRDIPDGVWNKHMKKYGDIYQLKMDEDFIWGIRCKNGRVVPYSIVKDQLVAVLDFETSRQLTFFQKKLRQEAGCDYKITQEGDTDVCILFQAQDLKKMTHLLRLRRKRQLSPETLAKYRENIKKARECL
jgi:hypothetical protein